MTVNSVCDICSVSWLWIPSLILALLDDCEYCTISDIGSDGWLLIPSVIFAQLDDCEYRLSYRLCWMAVNTASDVSCVGRLWIPSLIPALLSDCEYRLWYELCWMTVNTISDISCVGWLWILSQILAEGYKMFTTCQQPALVANFTNLQPLTPPPPTPRIVHGDKSLGKFRINNIWYIFY